MPNCQKCLGSFPVSLIIEGKERNLQNRKYCLECSPFGLHNTRQLIDHASPTGKCEVCERDFRYNKKQGHQKTICNSCSVRKYHRDRKLFAVNFYGGKCIKCSYSKCVEALDFHHREETEKTTSPSNAIMKWSWDRAKIELDKCDLLCSNCHREVHAIKHNKTKAKIAEWKERSDKRHK